MLGFSFTTQPYRQCSTNGLEVLRWEIAGTDVAGFQSLFTFAHDAMQEKFCNIYKCIKRVDIQTLFKITMKGAKVCNKIAGMDFVHLNSSL